MSFKKFIKEYKKEIDLIVEARSGQKPANNEERREWIYNDEGLYRWAQNEGVKI